MDKEGVIGRSLIRSNGQGGGGAGAGLRGEGGGGGGGAGGGGWVAGVGGEFPSCVF